MMKIVYSSLTKEQLYNIKEYISLDNKKNAIIFLSKIKNKIEILATYPYLGKINTTFNLDNIRDFVIFGYKIIYKINKESILILSIYKYIDFDENSLI
ncbi:MAG: type II toxin-antitoxin system RelE/ParE family toxin [Aliarcobacter sp.]|nr:type II toxin-antitoxin system RelE/ParE family toxin [Aliarcobacter sp.]